MVKMKVLKVSEYSESRKQALKEQGKLPLEEYDRNNPNEDIRKYTQ